MRLASVIFNVSVNNDTTHEEREMKDVTTMKKAELLECISKANDEVFTQAQSEKWKVSQLREWLSENLIEDDERNLSNTMKEYRQKYTKATGYNGAATVNNGDDLAEVLLKLDPQEVVALAEKVLDLPEDELWNKYSHLNNGQKRMNAGNKLRFALKKGTITIKDIKKAARA